MVGIALISANQTEIAAAIEPLPVVFEQAELLEDTFVEELQGTCPPQVALLR